MFCNNRVQKGNVADMQTSLGIHEEVLFLLTALLALFTKYTNLAICSNICEKFMYNTANSGSFHGQRHCITWHLQHLYWKDVLNLMYLKICQQIQKQVFYVTGISFFALILGFLSFKMGMSQGQWRNCNVLLECSIFQRYFHKSSKWFPPWDWNPQPLTS